MAYSFQLDFGTKSKSLFLRKVSCAKKMNKNNYEWVTIGKTKFYTDGTTCTDIEVMDNAKTVSFIFPKFRIDREKCQKVFSSVENLMIGRNVLSIVIPNKMFPNVRKIESKSNNYMTGKYLIERTGMRGMRLVNTFGQDDGDAIDFTQFNQIGDYAFEGCKAKNAVGLDKMRISVIQATAFVDSGFLDQPFIGGIKCLGPFIIDIDETADEIILPKENVCYCIPKRPKYCVRVPNFNVLKVMKKMPKKVILEDEKIDEKLDGNVDLAFILGASDIEELESRVSRYKTVDGILYSANMKTLILCPVGKTGAVIIPDGVTKIIKNAFSNSKISKVVFPDSMVKLKDYAFYRCKYLKEIDFGHGIKKIGQEVFSECAFEKLIFPPQVKEIGIKAFASCGELKDVVFNEGLEIIRHGAFKNCPKLTEINLPASIKKVGSNALMCHVMRKGIQDVNVNYPTIE